VDDQGRQTLERPEPSSGPDPSADAQSGVTAGPAASRGREVSTGSGDRAVAALLAAAAVIAAILAARAAFLSSEASGAWQQMVRQEVKRGAAITEQVRNVYGSQATIAYQVVQQRVREQEFRAAAEVASGEARESLLFEADVHAQAEAALVEALAEDAPVIADSERYLLADGSIDLVRLLADVRAADPDLTAIDPDLEQARGDGAARRALLTIGAAIPVGVTFFLGALAQAIRRVRRPLLVGGAVSLAVGVVAGIAFQVLP
jgi:hypothetical protein